MVRQTSSIGSLQYSKLVFGLVTVALSVFLAWQLARRAQPVSPSTVRSETRQIDQTVNDLDSDMIDLQKGFDASALDQDIETLE
jgi:hypothetical protein